MQDQSHVVAWLISVSTVTRILNSVNRIIYAR